MSKYKAFFLPDGGSYVKQVLPLQQFGRVDHWNTESEAEHNKAYEAHINYQATAKQYPFPSLPKEWDGRGVTEGKDFKIEKQYRESISTDSSSETVEGGWHPIAIPLTAAEEEGKEAKEFETMKFPGNNFNQPTSEQEQQEILNWIEQAKNNKGNENTSEENAWSWVVLMYSRLKELVELKEIKDKEGKTVDYLNRQPFAWLHAKTTIELFDRDNNAPPKLAAVEPAPV